MATKTNNSIPKKRVAWAETNSVRSYTLSSSSPSASRKAPLGRYLAPRPLTPKQVDIARFATQYAIHIGGRDALDVIQHIRAPISTAPGLQRLCRDIERASGIEDGSARQDYYRYVFFNLYMEKPAFMDLFELMFWKKRYMDLKNKGITPDKLLEASKPKTARTPAPKTLRDITNRPSREGTYASKYRAMSNTPSKAVPSTTTSRTVPKVSKATR